MATKEQTSAPVDPQKLTEDDKEHLDEYLEVIGDRIEIIQWLSDYAYFFPDWLKLITNGVFSEIKKKRELNISCTEDEEALNDITFFFSKMAYFSGHLPDWMEELKIGKEKTEKMIEKLATVEDTTKNFSE